MPIQVDMVEAFVKLKVDDDLSKAFEKDQKAFEKLQTSIKSGEFEKVLKQRVELAQKFAAAQKEAMGIAGQVAGETGHKPLHKMIRESKRSVHPLSVFGSGGIGTQLGAFGGPEGAMAGAAFDIITGAVTKFTQAANPAAFERFTKAGDDMQAAIGDALLPVLELFTGALKFTGDVLHTILPNQQEMTSILKELDPYLNQVKENIAEWALALRDMKPLIIWVVKEGLWGLTQALMLMGKTAEYAAKGVRAVRWLFGGAKDITTPASSDLLSAKGMSNHGDPSFTGISQAKDAFRLAALKTSIGYKDIPNQQLDEAKKQTGILESILGHHQGSRDVGHGSRIIGARA